MIDMWKFCVFSLYVWSKIIQSDLDEETVNGVFWILIDFKGKSTFKYYKWAENKARWIGFV